MTPKVKEFKLISIYLYICDIYDFQLRMACERFRNNNTLGFIEKEVMTIYLNSMNIEQRLNIKQIHEYVNDHFRSWFPLLPSYKAFAMRLNRLSKAFKELAEILLSGYCQQDCDWSNSLMDFLPIIACSGKRVPSIAKEIIDKGYRSTKSMYYHGLKLHTLAFYRPQHLPFPESIVITPASENDLNVNKQNCSNIPNRSFYGDKNYLDTELLKDMARVSKSVIYTTVKDVKINPK